MELKYEFTLGEKVFTLTLNEACQIAKWYEVASTAEYIMENYDTVKTEDQAMELAEKVREIMEDNPCVSEENACKKIIENRGAYGKI